MQSKEAPMKSALKITTALALITSSAFAASGASSDENGLLVTLFLAFGAIIIIFQLVPGMLLFGSMLKGIFGKEEKAQQASE